mmetsp:Transcript_16945/g.40561  ORF Transcript_16945/g.40561 Transcript_16945/m.40561 type:complete len:261 (+) Transcript_16945:757-1539(+)
MRPPERRHRDYGIGGVPVHGDVARAPPHIHPPGGSRSRGRQSSPVRRSRPHRALERSLPVRPKHPNDVRPPLRHARGTDVLLHVPAAGTRILRALRGGHRGEEPAGTDIPRHVRPSRAVPRAAIEDGRLRPERSQGAERRGSHRPHVSHAQGRSFGIHTVRHFRGFAGGDVRHGQIAPEGEGRSMRRVAAQAPRTAHILPTAAGGGRDVDVSCVRIGQPGDRTERTGIAIVHVRYIGVRTVSGAERRGRATGEQDEDGSV